MLEVEWTDREGQFRLATALLEDICPLGLCLQLDVELPLNAVVVLNMNGVATRAMVQYCQWREIGFFAGLIFPPNSPWSLDRFAPKHLTNPIDLPGFRPAYIV